MINLLLKLFPKLNITTIMSDRALIGSVFKLIELRDAKLIRIHCNDIIVKLS